MFADFSEIYFLTNWRTCVNNGLRDFSIILYLVTYAEYYKVLRIQDGMDMVKKISDALEKAQSSACTAS
jgi:hypothetical protein